MGWAATARAARRAGRCARGGGGADTPGALGVAGGARTAHRAQVDSGRGGGTAAARWSCVSHGMPEGASVGAQGSVLIRWGGRGPAGVGGRSLGCGMGVSAGGAAACWRTALGWTSTACSKHLRLLCRRANSCGPPLPVPARALRVPLHALACMCRSAAGCEERPRVGCLFAGRAQPPEGAAGGNGKVTVGGKGLGSFDSRQPPQCHRRPRAAPSARQVTGWGGAPAPALAGEATGRGGCATPTWRLPPRQPQPPFPPALP